MTKQTKSRKPMEEKIVMVCPQCGNTDRVKKILKNAIILCDMCVGHIRMRPEKNGELNGI